MNGIITSGQRMSVHDGPGIRTVVFLKGCNMRCKWCHNPETWRRESQIQYIKSKCIGCRICTEVCPNRVLAFKDDELDIDYASCRGCGVCAANCCTGALSLIGREVSPEALWSEVKVDLPFFRNSGGGVTVSGGEPLLQKDFVRSFLALCRAGGVNTAIETNLSLEWERVEELLPLVDLWMCDLKLFDGQRHREWTGVDNVRIKDNMRRLAESGGRMLVRTPVIPGVNDNEGEIGAISDFLSDLKVEYRLLGFHTLGFDKYRTTGIVNELEGYAPLGEERLNELKRKFEINGR
ncbi:MAG: glycyl-radical enzyme activating protein [Bacteroidales bacterium]|nr:glycyl-radical enzyme activating protein [Bacteroidales bacterium]